MGTLADCLTKVGITGAKAKYITEQAAKWKAEGFDPQTAHVNTVKELLKETRKQQRSITKQLQDKLSPEQLDSVFPPLPTKGATNGQVQAEGRTQGEVVPTEAAQLRDRDVRPVPVSELSIDPDRFQFKGHTNDSGVVDSEQLQGEYNPLAGGVILVWEDKSGKKFVVNGHHRYDLARRNGVDTVNAQVVREVDGITAEAARALGAELNILEGQGSIDDYAQFFRETGISEQAADKRGLLARSKGKTGFLVGKFASDDTWAAYRSGKISAEKAAVISDIGRDDPGFQAVGLDRARTLNADQLASTLRALKLFPRNTSATQSDLFGFDDSAMVEAEAMGKAQDEIVRDLKDRVLAVRGTLKRPAKAKEMGLSGDIEAIQAEVNRLTDEIDRWSKWTTDRELVAKVRERAGLSTEAPADDFQLSGEGSKDTSPIVAPYAVPDEARLPTRKTERQPQLGGMPEDLDESVLAGQQGLFSATKGEQLQPSTPKVIVTPPKSQREIIAALSKSLDIPIRFGRLKNKLAGGVFFKKQNIIASKKANDVPVVTHEVGHKLDAMFNLSQDKNIRSELEILGDPDTPGSRSSWTKSKTKAYKLGEGLAEFVRYWMTDPKKAKADAPNTHAAFEAVLDANKDLGDAMRQAQEDIQLWRTAQPQARLRSQISIGENPNKTRYSISQLTRDVVDDLHYLRLATEDAKLGEPGLLPSKNPYLLARNLRGSYGMASTFIQNGVVDFNTRDVQLGTSLEDALKPVAGRINDFRDWIVAKRAQELESQGRPTGLVKSDIDAVVEKFKGDTEFEKAFADLKRWNDAVLKYSVDAGLVTPESAAAMRKMNEDYVPFHRLFEVGAGEAPSSESTGKGSGLNPGKPGSLKQLKGSTRNIVDPLETMVKNAYAIITASEKSAISLAVADMAKLPNMGKWVEEVAIPMQPKSVRVDEIIEQLESLGADVEALEKSADVLTFFRQARRPAKGENTISVVRNGKTEFYRLNRYLHDTFEALDLEDSSTFIRIMSAPAQLLRAGVTLEPGFNIANAMRDTFGAAVIGRYGALPFETTIKGIAALVKNPQLVAEWSASGGRSSVEANYFDRKKMQKYLAERISKDLTPAERALIVARSPLRFLRFISTTLEEATRIGEYQVAYESLTKSGLSDGEARRLAAFEARDRQDFAKGGAKTKILRHAAAFWNAQLQANVRLAQAFKERPVQTIAKGVAFVTLPKLLEQALNWDDEDYWNRPQWERDAFYMIPIGKDDAGHTRFLRIPVPFEIGIIFATVPGRFLQWAKKNNPDAVKDIPGMFLKQTVPVPNPSGAVTAMELIPDQGYSYFRGREIVPDSMADMPKDLQWTAQTSALAKKIGETFGVSPMKVDYLIESTTGGLGKVGMGKQVPGERFVTNPLANVGQPIADFYEIRDKLTKDSSRIKATGEHQGFGPVMLAEFEATAERIGALRSKARDTTDKVAKAKLDDEAYQLAVDMVQKYRENPEPEEAITAYAQKRAETVILNSGKPERKKKKLGSKEPGESEEDYQKRVDEWQATRDSAEKWLIAHKDSPAVQTAIENAAKKITRKPAYRGDKDYTYQKRAREWREKYGKSADMAKSLK
mgnify:CR=1 FL=1